MGNYLNKIENTKDYLGNDTPMFKELIEMPERPEGQLILTHLRMLYGHVDWQNMIIEVDQLTIELLQKNADRICEGENLLGELRVGQIVALINRDTMGAVTFNELKTGKVDIEVLDLEGAIERSAHWLIDEISEATFDFKIFSPYFLLAFRLALLKGVMDDDERFSDERLEQVWKTTTSDVLVCACFKLLKDVTKGKTISPQVLFHLSDYEVSDYLNNM